MYIKNNKVRLLDILFRGTLNGRSPNMWGRRLGIFCLKDAHVT